MNFSSVNKILIIRLSSLGDVLLTTPLLRSIKKNNPIIKIDFLVKSDYKDVLNHNPNINNLILYDKYFSDLKILIKELKKQNYDIVIDLQNSFRSNKILKNLEGRRYRFNKRTKDKFLLVKFKINKLKDAPQIPERYAETIGIKLDEEGLDLNTIKQHSEKINNQDNIIAFCPGSRHFTKMWLEEYYVELGKILVKENYTLILLGGKSDRLICKEISSRIDGAIDLSNDDDLLQTAIDMKKCEAVVCNDSGLMHVACAVKIPVLTFFGSTVKEFGFTPYKNKNLILENNSLSCRPCSHIGRDKCPKGHFKCMLDIYPEDAFNALLRLLNK